MLHASKCSLDRTACCSQQSRVQAACRACLQLACSLCRKCSEWCAHQQSARGSPWPRQEVPNGPTPPAPCHQLGPSAPRIPYPTSPEFPRASRSGSLRHADASDSQRQPPAPLPLAAEALAHAPLRRHVLLGGERVVVQRQLLHRGGDLEMGFQMWSAPDTCPRARLSSDSGSSSLSQWCTRIGFV